MNRRGIARFLVVVAAESVSPLKWKRPQHRETNITLINVDVLAR